MAAAVVATAGIGRPAERKSSNSMTLKKKEKKRKSTTSSRHRMASRTLPASGRALLLPATVVVTSAVYSSALPFVSFPGNNFSLLLLLLLFLVSLSLSLFLCSCGILLPLPLSLSKWTDLKWCLTQAEAQDQYFRRKTQQQVRSLFTSL